MQRYFFETSYTGENEFLITDKEITHHIKNVMRMTEDDEIIGVFPHEEVYRLKIQQMDVEGVRVSLEERMETNVELPIHVTIASAFPKGEKIDWITQKGTELGAYNFIFYPGKSSVVKWDEKKREKRKKRLLKIAQEASEQSHRTHLPKVELFDKFQSLVDVCSEYDKVFVAWEESAKNNETSLLVQEMATLNKGNSVLFIFGAEGGISKEEINQLKEKGAIPVGLGPRILRTETAPLYALSAVSVCKELMKEEKNGE